MVYFVCEGCNETLKKNQVDKHANQCRNCYAVTCVDCSVTFHGNDYAAHTSCVSEAQKYEGSLYKPKQQKLNPQEAWMEVVQKASEMASTAPHNVSQHLSRLAELSNIPRNRKKFANFVSNSMRLHSAAVIDAIFDFLETVKAKLDEEAKATKPPSAAKKGNNSSASSAAPAAATEAEAEVDSEDKSEKKSKKKKRKHAETVAEAAEEVTTKVAATADDEEDEESKNSKKSKKHKKKHSKEVEAEADAVGQLSTEDLTKSSKKSKKHKKDKSSSE